MASSEELIADVVSSVIEKVLVKIGPATYATVSKILADYNLSFSGCYQNPDVFNFALKKLSDDAYLSVVEKIKGELVGLVDDDRHLAAFVQKLGE